MAEAVPIPEPPGLPLIGNLGEFTTTPLQDIKRLAETYGEIFRLHLGTRPIVFCSTNALVNELCDEKRFHKSLQSSLRIVREGIHDGLFTAHDDEPNWGKAHRVLISAFGPLSIRGMFDEMHDIATQLCMKFARHGSQCSINTSDDFTRLALDTLALCAMDFRFNSYYSQEMHPFVKAMSDFLTEAGRRNKRPAFAPNFLYRAANEKFYDDIAIMRKTADDVVANRKKNPSDRKDLLNAMLNGVDPTTREKLSDDNITDQLITFLIAGHETTSGLLSFAFYYLLKNPSTYQKVQQEVDQVIGREQIKVDHLTKLPYVASVLRETLRLSSGIPGFSVEAYEDTLLAGKFLVRKGEPVTALLTKAHVDPVVFGEDAMEFKPERLSDENFDRLSKEFPNCWKPFGNGKRACIGRPFAWQEALLSMAMLFQNFNFTMADPSYHLEIQETLTIKPKGFYMRASLRHDMTPTELEQALAGKAGETTHHDDAGNAKLNGIPTQGKPLAVFYGSNSGTCEALAQRVAADAPRHGFRATTVAPLDDANQKVPKDRPVIIITASYEGQPPSNAALFVAWIESLKGKEMNNVSYTVFGCGHHDWAQTFHRIPKLVDSTLEVLGGNRILPLATTDAAERDMFGDFEAWEDDSLWPALQEKYEVEDSADATGDTLSVEISVPRKTTLRQDVEEAIVISTKTLTNSGSVKKHIEIQLPTGMTYRAGDYLAVLPFNPKSTVSRVFKRFQLSWDAMLKIHSDRPTSLPTEAAVSAADVLGAYVELSQPATKRNLQTLVQATQDKKTMEKLQKVAGDDYQVEITNKRTSILDLLEKFSAISLPFASFLAMLPPMRVRQYSISSSPLADATKLTLTYGVLAQPALSGQGSYYGVASNFLSSLTAGERLHVAVRPSQSFHLPSDAENTPLICIAAGSGLAPFRGFVQERAAMIAAGRKVAPALLFFGCRSPDQDDLYAEEFANWERLGAVDVRRAYSRSPSDSKDCKYVQHRLSHDCEDIDKLWQAGAKIYVCGSKDVGKAVEEVFLGMVQEAGKKDGANDMTPEKAKEWFDKQRNERYVTDVFD
ncbi:NADPH-P450 reductase [Metarhizium album ARSEF 1941]|uniref:Bifunctional cytochrome P450/NADPH--P450 reductase n=1 Tax=Metarhizium album (strain ARSEF 1941) TaxID=1081103 RepID=A0A0B2WUZ2_METAS|nr:NADPH-P450 reductase [Metarhizium album ARSEF 1941]KHN97898.1 NADPH-P450 reductase [Metarhizium album ARSEF 1941]